MSKELVVSATRHETRIAILEDDTVVEIFYQREKEYSLAGSIHKGKVTRVLPGMQSAFVDIGLERDAFLYVTDFMELDEMEDEDDLDLSTTAPHALNGENGSPAQLESGSTVTIDSDDADGESEGGASVAGQSQEGGGFRRSRRRRRGRKDKFAAPGSHTPATDVPLREASAAPLMDDEDGD